MPNNYEVKPYTMQELCNMYQVSDAVMRKWFKPFENEIGNRVGWFYNVSQVRTIFGRLGAPNKPEG